MASVIGPAGLLLAGCGGGNSSTGSGVSTTTALTQDERNTILTSIDQKYESLPHESQDADNDLMLTYLMSHPNLRSVQRTGTGTIAARFTDGPGYIFVNNLDDSRDLGRSAVVPSNAITRATNQLPSSETVYLLNGLTVLDGGGNPLNQFLNALRADQHIQRLDQMFRRRSYQTTSGKASIATLRSVSEAGILYFIGHGGLGIDENDKQIYIINTSDSTKSVIDDPLIADIKANYVGYMTFTGTEEAGTRRSKAAYYITPSFVSNYMSFSKYSLVFINGCASVASPTTTPDIPTPKFDQAFFAAQTSAYIGWDNKVNAGDVRDSAEFFFDRLLGANLSDVPHVKQSPAVRPFDYTPIISEMQSVPQSGQTFNLTQSLPTANSGDIANLTIRYNPNDPDTFGFLAPSIENLVVGGTLPALSLIIRGNFGNDPQTNGSVTISREEGDETLLAIRDWQPTQIRCDLPTTGGDVIVAVHQHRSNPRRLTEWKGKLKYEGSGPEDHKESFTMQLHILADIQSARTQPDQTFTGADALLQGDRFNTLPYVTGSYTNSGKFTGKYSNWSWMGAGAIPPSGLGQSPGFHYEGNLDPVAKTLHLYFGMQAPDGLKIDYKDEKGNITSTATGNLSISTTNFPKYRDNPALGKILFRLGANLEILAGAITDSITFQMEDDTGTTSTSLTWDTIPVTLGTKPDPNASRSVPRN